MSLLDLAGKKGLVVGIAKENSIAYGCAKAFQRQTLQFSRPVTLGDTLTVSVKAATQDEQQHRVTFECDCITF
jgi:enoyl-[acyl-carrier-protein] reductase (NADH)